METLEQIESRPWWDYMGEDIQKLFKTSDFIYDQVRQWGADLPGGKQEFDDFSFVVFPAAKAYEGFLKKLFLDMGLITENDYFGKHFRIGKALNPSLPKELRNESVYFKIIDRCGSKELAEKMWDTWRLSRNLTFHWFPNEKNAITLDEAGERIAMIIDTIDWSFKQCPIKKNK